MYHLRRKVILGSANASIKEEIPFFSEKLLHKQNISFPKVPDICHFTAVPSVRHPDSSAPLQPSGARSCTAESARASGQTAALPHSQKSNYNLPKGFFFSSLASSPGFPMHFYTFAI